jgi:hypothetical protein
MTRTPSGGAHYVVLSSGLGKISPLTADLGHVGDYIGGRPDGTGRLLGFLPDSVRVEVPRWRLRRGSPVGHRRVPRR